MRLIIRLSFEVLMSLITLRNNRKFLDFELAISYFGVNLPEGS